MKTKKKKLGKFTSGTNVFNNQESVNNVWRKIKIQSLIKKKRKKNSKKIIFILLQ